MLFNAFEGPPRIVRLWGKGEVLEYGTSAFRNFVKENDVRTIAGTRAVVVVHIHQVGSSCGFSMPFFDFKDFRPTLNEYFEKRVASEEAGKKEDGIERYVSTLNISLSTNAIFIFHTLIITSLVIFISRIMRCLSYILLIHNPSYWALKNSESMDGLPGLQRGVETARKDNVKPIKKMVGPYATMIRKARSGSVKTVSLWYVVIIALLSFCMGMGAVLLLPPHILALYSMGRNT